MTETGSPTIAFESRAAFRAWLEDHQDDQDGIWLKLAKAGSGIASITYPEAVDIALCFGWIDGLKRPFDESYWLQRFTPRRPRSKWSKINVGKAEALIASGEMTAAGLAEIERAKADGRWAAAYAPQSAAVVPDDLQAALDRNPAAAAHFAQVTRNSRYAILFRIHDAKRADTRARRIAEFVDQLAAGEEPYPSTRKT
jgi:uncharacterized protein YdeI (YjbR/CyaY-like superfamily)